ncbi:MAG: hypothetical protein KA224_03410 [Steroidobacteraceae bacterium]|nr:hypothetical protein [Steroidobacteraceae bacterium]
MTSTPNANLIVLTADSALIDMLRAGTEGRHRIWRADSIERAGELLKAARLGVVLLDAGLGGFDTPTLVARVSTELPNVPLLVAGRRDDESSLAEQISSGEIFRFMHKPLSPERTRTFIDAAVRRRLELDPDAAKAPEVQVPPESVLPPLAPVPVSTPPRPSGAKAAAKPSAQPAGRGHRMWWPKRASDQDKLRLSLVPALGFGVAGVIVIATLIVQPWKESAPKPGTLSNAPAGLRQSPRDTGIARLLDAAGVALTQGRLNRPPGRNAVELYLAVIAIDKGNARAQEGLNRAADALVTQAEDALVARDLAAAEAAVASAREANPQHLRLTFLDSLIESEKERRKLEEAQAGSAPKTMAPTDKVLSIADRARADSVKEYLLRAAAAQRLGRFAGGSESAQSYIMSAMELAPSNPEVLAAASALSGTMLQHAEQAIAKGDYAAARELLDHAEEFGINRPAVQRARAQFESQRAATIGEENARLFALANQRIAQGLLLDPAADSAAHYVDLLMAADPGFRGLAETMALLGSRLLDESRRLEAAGRRDEARRALDAAASYGARPGAR